MASPKKMQIVIDRLEEENSRLRVIHALDPPFSKVRVKAPKESEDLKAVRESLEEATELIESLVKEEVWWATFDSKETGETMVECMYCDSPAMPFDWMRKFLHQIDCTWQMSNEFVGNEVNDPHPIGCTHQEQDCPHINPQHVYVPERDDGVWSESDKEMLSELERAMQTYKNEGGY